ncbi:sugar ABC transporter substrate-binding protein [Actinoplanes sp. NPDC049265]|uniref:sugar ABC transporter substrate-binding protein n=1 Tax=Actinoplanes sp. NPDC049265 TaxID=3363902 RepID=UPI00371BD577
MSLVLGLGGCTLRRVASHPAVGFLTADEGMGYVREMTMGYATTVADAGGVEHTEAGPPIGDTAQQAGMLADLHRESRDGIAVFTWNPELLAAPMAATGAAGTPVISVYSPPAPGSDVGLYIGNDNYTMGEMLADQIGALLPPDTIGTVVLGTSVPGAQALDERIAGLRSRLPVVRPGVRLLGPFDTKQDPAGNMKSWELLVGANSTAVAFVGTGDSDARNLARLRGQATRSWVGAGFGLDDIALRAVGHGDYALVSPEPFVQGAIAGWLQAEQVKGNLTLPTGWIPTPAIAVTPQNAPALLARQSSTKQRAESARVVVQEIVTHLGDHLRPLADAR